MPKLTLYHYWRSSSSWRVRLAVEHLGIKAQMVHVHLLNGESESAEHRARHPLGYVPVLQVDDRYLIESVSIIEWLDENSNGKKLYPKEPFARAHVRTLVETINSEIQPLQNLTILEHLTDDEAKKKEWAQYFNRRGLEAYVTLCEKTAGTFSVGDEFGAADVFLIPQLYAAQRFGVTLDEFPLLKRIYANASQLPAFKASEPERFKPEGA